MPNIHIEKWATQASIDYYMQFIKAWIPFNAWYKQDRLRLAKKAL